MPGPNCRDNIDVSNPSPIIHKNGSIIMLYKGSFRPHETCRPIFVFPWLNNDSSAPNCKGRGKTEQHMGLAFAPSIDAPFTRNGTGAVAPDLPGEVSQAATPHEYPALTNCLSAIARAVLFVSAPSACNFDHRRIRLDGSTTRQAYITRSFIPATA
eukprot:SAG11_NODE_847_length_6882_cov_3.352204_2_plen_156_part_00